jgi:hypothetical protein
MLLLLMFANSQESAQWSVSRYFFDLTILFLHTVQTAVKNNSENVPALPSSETKSTVRSIYTCKKLIKSTYFSIGAQAERIALSNLSVQCSLIPAPPLSLHDDSESENSELAAESEESASSYFPSLEKQPAIHTVCCLLKYQCCCITHEFIVYFTAMIQILYILRQSSLCLKVI